MAFVRPVRGLRNAPAFGWLLLVCRFSCFSADNRSCHPNFNDFEVGSYSDTAIIPYPKTVVLKHTQTKSRLLNNFQ